MALAHGAILKALAMIVLGLLLGMVGTDIYTGTPRFTLGLLELSDGLSFVAVAVGVFGIAEILRNLENETERDVVAKKVSGLMPTRADLGAIALPMVRGTAIGSALGILPGGGAILSAFAAYSVEKRISRTPRRFGHGAIEGVAAPEAANNAGAQTSFIPMLTLGIPANPVMALMIGAMIVQGITPGPNVATERPDLFWGIIASMWVGNLLLVVLNLPLIGIWVKLLQIPYYALFPAIIAFCSIGVFSVNNNGFDLFTVVAVRPHGLCAGEARLRARTPASGLRARTDARGEPAPRHDHIARRSVGVPDPPAQRRSHRRGGDRAGGGVPAGGREEAGRGFPGIGWKLRNPLFDFAD